MSKIKAELSQYEFHNQTEIILLKTNTTFFSKRRQQQSPLSNSPPRRDLSQLFVVSIPNSCSPKVCTHFHQSGHEDFTGGGYQPLYRYSEAYVGLTFTSFSSRGTIRKTHTAGTTGTDRPWMNSVWMIV